MFLLFTAVAQVSVGGAFAGASADLEALLKAKYPSPGLLYDPSSECSSPRRSGSRQQTLPFALLGAKHSREGIHAIQSQRGWWASSSVSVI